MDNDLSFLEDIENFVESLGPAFYYATFAVEDPDVRIVECTGLAQFQANMKELFPDGDRLMQVTVPCAPDRVGEGVAYYRFYLDECHLKSPMNYHLQSFVARLDLQRVPFRSTRGVCIALTGDSFNQEFWSIPSKYHIGNVGFVEAVGDLDVETIYPRKSVEMFGVEEVYPLFGSCLCCHAAKKPCTKVFPCARCPEGMCAPNPSTYVSNCRKIQQDWLKGAFHHNDTVKYLVYLQAVAVGGRTGFRNLDIRVLAEKLNGILASNPRTFLLPDPHLEKIPQELRTFIGQEVIFKVEWFYAAGYHSFTTDKWGEYLNSSVETHTMATKENIPYVMCDNHGIADSKVAINMLIESVESPMFPIAFYGKLMWKQGDDKFKTAFSTVKKMTYVADVFNFITVTTVHKGYLSELGKLVRRV